MTMTSKVTRHSRDSTHVELFKVGVSADEGLSVSFEEGGQVRADAGLSPSNAISHFAGGSGGGQGSQNDEESSHDEAWGE